MAAELQGDGTDVPDSASTSDSGISSAYDSDMESITSSTYAHTYDGNRRSENPVTAITFSGTMA